MADEQVNILLGADSRGFVRSFNDASSAVKNLASGADALVRQFNKAQNAITSTVKSYGLAIAGTGAAMALYGRSAVKSYASVETALANVATVADHTAISMDDTARAIRSLALRVPKSLEELSQGLYNLNSAGFYGVEALEMLEAASKFSIAGLATMGDTVSGLTSIMNAYGLQARDAAHVTDVMFKAVEVGQLTAQEFANNIGDWSAIAATLGVGFETVSAAIATLTKGGQDAAAASTAISAVMRQLINPSEAAADALTRMGYESGQAAVQALGLEQVLVNLWESAGSLMGFAEIMSDVRALRGSLPLVTTQFENFTTANAEFNDKLQTSGTVARQVQWQMNTLNAQSEILSNQWREFKLVVGELLVPLRELTTAFGITLLGGINSLPMPIRKVLAGLSLMAPAAVLLGGVLAVTAIKVIIFQKALVALKASALVNAIAPLKALVFGIHKAGGVIPFLIGKVFSLSHAFKLGKISLLKFSVALVGVPMLAAMAAYSIYQLTAGYRNLQAQAKAAAEEVGNFSGAQSNWDALQVSIQNINLELERLSRYRDLSVAESIWGGIQLVNPFDRNTIAEGFEGSKALDKHKNEILDYQLLVAKVSQETGLDLNASAQALSGMAAQGLVDLEMMTQAYREYYDAMNMTLATPEQIASGEPIAMDPNIQNILETVGPMFEAFTAEIRLTAEESARLQEEQEKVATASQRAGVAAGDLQNAMEKIADAAASAGDKVSAFTEIVDLLTGKNISLARVQAALGRSFSDAFNLIEEGGFSLEAYDRQEGEDDNRLSEIRSNAISMAQAIFYQTGSVEQAAAVFVDLEEAIWAMGEEAGLSRQQIGEMIEMMGLTPDKIEAIVSLPGIDSAISNLQTTASYLSGIDGYTARAGVQVTVGVNTVMGQIGSPLSGGLVRPASGFIGPMPPPIGVMKNIQSQIGDIAKGAMQAITSGLPKDSSRGGGGGGGGRGGGGGGGGGGASSNPDWAMTPEQRSAVARMYSEAAKRVVDPRGYAAFLREEAARVRDYVLKAEFSKGLTQVGASILKNAEAEGQDPGRTFDEYVQAFNRAVELVGEGVARQATMAYRSLADFQNWIDQVAEGIQTQIRTEDYLFSRGEINTQRYIAILRSRMKGLKKYSDEWISLMDQIQSVERDQTEERMRLASAKYELDEINLKKYRSFLQQEIKAYKKYSQGWMEIWREIRDLNEQEKTEKERQEKEAKDAADERQRQLDRERDMILSFKNDVIRIYSDLYRGIVDPIYSATDLLSAFGKQASVSMGQVQGFYDHMREGTQRWVETIRQLRDAGLDPKFLSKLIAEGPSSLGFATSILGMGTEGISTINQGLQDIEDLTSPFGQEFAGAQVGTLVQSQTNYTIGVGDITLTLDAGDTGITMVDVSKAIDSALKEVVDQINSGTYART